MYTYVAYNRLGGCNTWAVVVFESPTSAQEWIDNGHFEGWWHLGHPKIIPRRKVGAYAGRPKPFTGERLMIIRSPGEPFYGWVFPSHEGIPVWD